MGTIDVSHFGQAPPQIVRLFPLSEIVLLPHALLPLHIFEPRYRQMTEDALRDDRAITMILPRDPNSADPPPLCSVGCLGRIHHERRSPDGRFRLVLRGESRVRIEEELTTDRLYRSARVVVLEDQLSPALQPCRLWLREEIAAVLQRVFPHNGGKFGEFFKYLETLNSSGAFADVVTSSAPLSIESRQRLLETPSVDARLEMLLGALKRLTGGEHPPPERPFPHRFSSN